MRRRNILGFIFTCAFMNLTLFHTYGENDMNGNNIGQNGKAGPESPAANLFPGDSSFETGNESWFGCRSAGTTVFDGKYSLELDGAVERNCRTRLYYNLLRKDQEYTLSFYAKASVAGEKLNVGINNLYYQTFLRKTFALNEDWQRCVIAIPKQDKAQDFYMDLILTSDAKIWLDAVQLQEGRKVSEYSRPEKISLGLGNTGAPGNLLFEDEAVPQLEVGVLNNGSEKQELEMSFDTVDYSGKIIFSKKENLSLEPGSTFRKKIPAMEKMSLGYFISTVALSGKDGKAIARRQIPFGVVPRPLPEESSPDSFFGIHAGRVTLAALPRIGVKWIRHFTTWWQGEKEKGTLSIPDDYYDQYMKYGFSVMDCLKAQVCPKWAIGDDGKLKDIRDYSSFCRRYVEKMKGKVKFWEIENEPDLDFVRKFNMPLKEAAEYYADVVNSAGPVIKEADPEAAVLAISNSGMESNFCETALKRCAGAFDIMTIHPYTGTREIGPNSTSVAPETYLRKKILGFVDTLKKYGKGQRLWVDELGWAIDDREAYLSEYTRKYSDYVARTMIICKSVPEVEHLFWFKAQGCYEKQFYQYGLWRSEFEPLPAAVFYANIAKILCRTKPVKVLFQNDVQAYAFEKSDGGAVVALWKYQGSTNEMALDFPEGSSAITDIFGNEVREVRKEGRLVVPLSESPVFIQVKDLGTAKVCEVISNASINMEPVSLTLSMSEAGSVGGTARNNYPREQKVEVCLKDGIGQEKIQLVLPPDGVQAFSFKVPAADVKAEWKYLIECSTPSGKVSREMKVELNRCSSASPVGGGFPEMLRMKNAITLADRKYIYPPDPGIAWQSPEDLSCAFNCAWDPEYFYFSADVTDKVFFQKSDNYQAWHGDSIQLAFDTLNDAPENSFQFNEDDAEFIAWLSPRGARIAKTYSANKEECGTDVQGAKISIVRKEKTTEYRIAIPWKTLGRLEPVKGRIFGFNFIVNNNDGNGRNYWLGLTNGIGEVKYPFIYRKFMLDQESGK